MTASASEGSDETRGTTLELVRVVDRTDFVSPTDYNREKEFVIRNDTAESKNYVFLPLNGFRLNLEVFDEDGRKLNYYPNDEVEDLLEDIEEENEDQYEHIQESLGGSKYNLFVQLPPNEPITPGEFRTVRLTFGQAIQPEYHRVWEDPLFKGWWTHWKQKFFRIPSFVASAKQRQGQSHSELFVVEGPPEYVTVAEKSDEHADREQFYENGYGDDTRVLSTHLPPTEESDYQWKLSYDLIPNNTGLLQLSAVYFVTAVIFAICILASQLALFFGLTSFEILTIAGVEPDTVGRTIAAGFVSICATVMYGLRAEWAERYRILCIVPIGLHGISWLLWSLLGINGG